MTRRDPNEILKTISKVAEMYDGFLMGQSDIVNDSVINNIFEANETTSFEKDKTKLLRNSFFATLLDSSIGSFYTQDLITGKGIFESEKNTEVLGDLSDYLAVLTDTDVQTRNSNFDNCLLKAEDDRIFVSTNHKPADLASMRAVVKEYQTNTGEFGSDIVNKNGKLDNASLVNKKMSAFIIKDSDLNFGNRRKDILNVFFNAITPLELSRCTPYIELTFYHQNFSNYEDHGYLNPIAYMKFDQEKNSSFSELYPISEESKKSNLVNTDIGFMNIFTSPQTMVNANINNEPSTFSLTKIKNNGSLNALEPFAPQATLKSLTLSTTSGGFGFTSEKRGSINIIIHDRSRLKDFAPIASINHLARSRVKVSFGWSHPDGDLGSNNPIGKFLDSLKSTQDYTLNKSDLRFEGNSIDVSIDITSLGLNHISDISTAAGSKVPLRIVGPVIESTVNSLIEKAKSEFRQSGTETSKIAHVHPQLEVLITSSNSTETMISSLEYEELQRLIQSNVDGSKDLDIIKKVANLLGLNSVNGAEFSKFELKNVLKSELATDDSKKSTAEVESSLNKSIKEKTGRMIRQKIANLTLQYENNELAQADYFTEKCMHRKAKSSQKILNKIRNNPEYISLGKIISNFIAAPMIASGEYSEVQMFFYPVNSMAGGARVHTTASLPIRKDELDSIIEVSGEENAELSESEVSIKLGSLTTKSMFRKIAALLQSTDLDAYGISEISTSVKIKRIEEVLEQALKDKDIASKYLADYYSKFKDNEGEAAFKKETEEKQKEILKTSISEHIQSDFKEKRKNKLIQIYKDDEMDDPSDSSQNVNTFRMISLNLEMEVMTPIKPLDSSTESLFDRVFSAKEKSFSGYHTNGRVLRIHITDASNIGSPNVDLANQILFGGKEKKTIKSESTISSLTSGINNLSDYEIKEYIKRYYTTVIYGAGSSTIKSINVSSTTSDRIAQAKMMTYEKRRRSKSISKNVNTIAESVKMIPASIDLQILGCPIIERGNQIFIDMGTNTDLDNCYIVDSVTHSISEGDFTTSLGLKVGNQGTISNTRGAMLSKLNQSLKE